mgnify:CR=1 FL=1
MLAHAKLPKTFWAEALMTAAYVINQSPSVPLDGDIPQRVWTGKDLSYRQLRVFSCLSYVDVAKDQREKLDLKSRQCIFLGYDDDEFGYRLWNLAEKKVTRNRDIVFIEEKTIVNWEIENKTLVTKSSQVDARRNQEEIDSIEIESEPVGRLNTRQNREPTKEQGESTERGIESDSANKVEQESIVLNGGRRYPLRERKKMKERVHRTLTWKTQMWEKPWQPTDCKMSL